MFPENLIFVVTEATNAASDLYILLLKSLFHSGQLTQLAIPAASFSPSSRIKENSFLLLSLQEPHPHSERVMIPMVMIITANKSLLRQV